MTYDRPAKSHATAWTITLIVAVPLLYLLSVAPLNYHLDPPWAKYNRPIEFTAQPLTWLDRYSIPYYWLHGNTPLKRPLQVYERFWWSAMHPPKGPGP